MARSVPNGESIRLVYADPPYPGKASYYKDHPDYGGEVDHAALITQLAEYDGWALSTSARALQSVLALCPAGARVAAWHRGERHNKASLEPQNAWEPVIYFGGRRVHLVDTTRAMARADASRGPARRVLELGKTRAAAEHDAYAGVSRRVPPADATRRAAEGNASTGSARRVDSLVYSAHPRLTDSARVIGAKPAVFCRWIFDLLGAQPQDNFTDLYPGSGGVLRAWTVFSGRDEAAAPEDG